MRQIQKKVKTARIPRPDYGVEALRQQFVYPLKEAAMNLGICEAALKRNCRRQQIKKWPYRQLHAVSKKIQQTEESLRLLSSPHLSVHGANELQKIENTLHELKKKREIIYQTNPLQPQPPKKKKAVPPPPPLLGASSILTTSTSSLSEDLHPVMDWTRDSFLYEDDTHLLADETYICNASIVCDSPLEDLTTPHVTSLLQEMGNPQDGPTLCSDINHMFA